MNEKLSEDPPALVIPEQYMLDYSGNFVFTALERLSKNLDDVAGWKVLLRSVGVSTALRNINTPIDGAVNSIINNVLSPEMTALSKNGNMTVEQMATLLLETKNNSTTESATVSELWNLCGLEVSESSTANIKAALVNYASKKVSQLLGIDHINNPKELKQYILSKISTGSHENKSNRQREVAPSDLSPKELPVFLKFDEPFRRVVLALLKEKGVVTRPSAPEPESELTLPDNSTITLGPKAFQILFPNNQNPTLKKKVSPYGQKHRAEHLLTPQGHGRRLKIYERLVELRATDPAHLGDIDLQSFFPKASRGPKTRPPTLEELEIALQHNSRKRSPKKQK